MSKLKSENYNSVWDAIADTPSQAANLRARTELMRQISAIVVRNKWTQTKAASHCGITQPRMNDLLRGRVSCFSLDALVNIATAIGCRVHFELKVVASRQPSRVSITNSSSRTRQREKDRRALL